MATPDISTELQWRMDVNFKAPPGKAFVDKWITDFKTITANTQPKIDIRSYRYHGPAGILVSVYYESSEFEIVLERECAFIVSFSIKGLSKHVPWAGSTELIGNHIGKLYTFVLLAVEFKKNWGEHPMIERSKQKKGRLVRETITNFRIRFHDMC